MKQLIAACLLLYSSLGLAAINVYDFASPEDEARYKHLAEELRCLVCQNQNLADSNAELAQDLKNEVVRMINEGKNDQEIIDFMVARYGDFVLYRPPVRSSTAMLWFGPFLLFAVGGLILIVMLRRRHAAAPTEAQLDEDEQQRLKNLLDKEDV